MSEQEHPRAAAERRIVAQLSEAMLTKLAQRRHHGSWDGSIWDAMNGVLDEAEELRQAVRDFDTCPCAEHLRELISECADVGARAAMVLDVATRDPDVLSREGDS
jgi:hypothetical protein